MSRLVVAASGSALTLLMLDALWLTLMAGPLYRTQLPGLMLEGFRPAPAVLFYLIYIAGIVYFAVTPALQEASLGKAALNGALLGLVAYGTYDLTNQATLKTWSVTVTLADMAWGSFITATSASVGTFAALRWS